MQGKYVKFASWVLTSGVPSVEDLVGHWLARSILVLTTFRCEEDTHTQMYMSLLWPHISSQ